MSIEVKNINGDKHWNNICNFPCWLSSSKNMNHSRCVCWCHQVCCVVEQLVGHISHSDKEFIFCLLLTVSYDVTSARDMLLLASCQDEQKKWVTHLVKKIPKNPPSTFVRASPRTMSTRSSANQSFRKAVKNTSGKTRWETTKAVNLFN